METPQDGILCPKYFQATRGTMKKSIVLTGLFLISCLLWQNAVWAANKKVTLMLGDTYAQGSNSAPVTLVEFTDYQCPYCNKFHEKTFPKLISDLVQTGKVRFISRDLPLDFHPHAFPAARATRCAGDQKKYWQMRHLLSSNPRKLSRPSLLNYAQKLKLNIGRFRACLKSRKHDSAINKDLTDARRAGITGTPGFIIGHTPRRGSRFFRGTIISGVHPYKFFEEWVDYLISTIP